LAEFGFTISGYIRELIRQIVGIATNVNQLARWVHWTGHIIQMFCRGRKERTISGGIEIRFGKIGMFRNANILLDVTKRCAIMSL
jgi:hypothetical protein